MSATSRMIDELVKKELIERNEVEGDRRSKKLILTVGGEKFMNTLSIERVKIIEQSAATIANKVPFKILKTAGLKLFGGKNEGKL